MTAWVSTRDFPCPRCAVERGQRCVGLVGSHRGRDLRGFHAERTALATAENERRKAAEQ